MLLHYRPRDEAAGFGWIEATCAAMHDQRRDCDRRKRDPRMPPQSDRALLAGVRGNPAR
jgi:hypothetical protein